MLKCAIVVGWTELYSELRVFWISFKLENEGK
jgi:hypothetical protein